MALFINTNTNSLFAQNSLTKTNRLLATSLKRLSTGLRINSAKDDAAGLAISMRLSAQIRGLNQAQRNANDGISLAQVAEGALEETDSALQRIRELAVQASNDTYTSSDRADMQEEVDQLIDEINRISTSTTYNGKQLLDGTFTSMNIQVGAYGGQDIQITTTNTALSAGAIGASVDVTTQTNASAAIDDIDSAIDSISSVRANLGAIQNRFESVVSNLSNQSESLTAAKSNIMDADIAAESANLVRNYIIAQSGTAMLAQANLQPQMVLNLLNLNNLNNMGS